MYFFFLFIIVCSFIYYELRSNVNIKHVCGIEKKSARRERNLRIEEHEILWQRKKSCTGVESRESSFVYDCCKSEFFTIDSWNFFYLTTVVRYSSKRIVGLLLLF